MTVNPVNSGMHAAQAAASRGTERGEATSGGHDVRNDGDADDAAPSTPKLPPPTAPTTVNAKGEVVGTLLNAVT